MDTILDILPINRMVNHLSATQEMRMLRKSLEELDEGTVANALGITGIKHRLNDGLIKRLDPTVAKAFTPPSVSSSGIEPGTDRRLVLRASRARVRIRHTPTTIPISTPPRN